MSTIFDKLKIEIYGGSHEEVIGAIVDGFLPNTKINLVKLKEFMKRRSSDGAPWATPRIEDDDMEFLEGAKISDDILTLTGEKLHIQIKNNNVHKDDYENIKVCPRPSHADYVAYVRDGQIPSGGGRFSGRMTAPLCAIGGICKQLLEQKGIYIDAYISRIGTMNLGSYKRGEVYDKDRETKYNLPLIDRDSEDEVVKYICKTAYDGDSIGGIIECVVKGVKVASIGDALFDSIESKISYAVTAIPAVRGIEFGDGFDITELTGSQANDPLIFKDGEVQIETNKSGGINGGIANGNPITFAVAIRPTPSISTPQNTVDLKNEKNAILEVRGRHDACILPRAVPCVEASCALVIYEELLKRQ